MENGQKEVILFQSQRAFTVVSKRILCLLEDLRAEHEIHFNKLKDALPYEFESLINQADYFDQTKYSYLRKKVFDITGESKRELEEEINKCKLELIKENRNEIKQKEPAWKESKY